MAVVASNHMSEGLRGLEHSEELINSNTPTFTAVNGRDDRTTQAQEEQRGMEPNEPIKKAQNDVALRPEPTLPETLGAAGPAETPVTATEVTRDARSPISPRNEGQRRLSDGSHKRKRSGSHEFVSPGPDRDHGEIGRHANGTYEIPSRRPEPIEKQESISPPSVYPRPPLERPSAHILDREHPRPMNSEIDPHAEPLHQEHPYYTTHQHHHDASDARLADALQRENYAHEHMSQREQYGTPEEDEMRRAQYGEYGASRSSVSGADGDRKRRKRVFSNRTKTGCMTCRRRKKKCDEGHPECNNCLRGGFVCEGYTVRNTWQKPTPTKQPIPLQSKTGFPESASRDPHSQRQYQQELSPEHTGRTGPPAHQDRSISDGDRVKPINIDEEREHHYASPPGRSAWQKASRPYPSHPPHLSKYQPEMDHRPVHPAHENLHEIPEPRQYPSTTHQSRPQSHSEMQHPYATHPAPHNSHNASAVAQAALQHTRPNSQRPSPQTPQSERMKMLRGEYYLPYTEALMQDREQCAAAVWRFNNSTNPMNGNSSEERLRFFKAILSLRPKADNTGSAGPDARGSTEPPYIEPVGNAGSNVIVEAPFHCDYGYNITIGDNVVIGPDCRITDSCAVTIGSNVIFSPNVKLICATYAIDPRERKKGQGRALGRAITIEDDVWIGSNVTILPGCKVGRCSTVGAGSLIHKDVPPCTVVAGNPQKVVRGIYQGNN